MRHLDSIAAVVLAAGYSSRMEEFKPLLPLGGMTALERCVRLFQNAAIRDVRVVVGHRASEVIPLVASWDVRWILNDRFQEGMLSSIKAGIHDLTPECEAFFLLPVDIPLVRPTTVTDLLEAGNSGPAGIFYPCFHGRRGHPPLISTKYRDPILAWEQDGGLRTFLKMHEQHAADVAVADEHILLDMDTRQEYEDLVAGLEDYEVPSAAECMALLTEKLCVERRIVAHSRKVAEVALQLAQALNSAGTSLKLKLVVAAALLHDLAKGKANHAAAAAEMLAARGHPSVARVVAPHMNCHVSEDRTVTVEELLYFCDKIVQEDRIVSLESRFETALRRPGAGPRIQEYAAARLACALRIRKKLETALGGQMKHLLDKTSPNGPTIEHEDLSVEAR